MFTVAAIYIRRWIRIRQPTITYSSAYDNVFILATESYSFGDDFLFI